MDRNVGFWGARTQIYECVDLSCLGLMIRDTVEQRSIVRIKLTCQVYEDEKDRYKLC